MEDEDRRRAAQFAGPPTIEEQISPFHLDTSPGRTIQGMPAARLPEPRITSKMSATESVPILTPPQIIHVPPPGTAELLPADGPTDPDGLPSLMGAASPSHEIGLDEMATDPYAGLRVKGVVPPVDAPKIQISKSMEYDVSALRDSFAPPGAPTVPTKRPVQAPTEVSLPALKRQKEQKKERSDAWLIVALFLLLFVIAALIAAVAVGVLQRMG